MGDTTAQALQGTIARLTALHGTAPIRPVVQDVAGEVSMESAVASLLAAFPGSSVQTWRDHGEAGWLCRETGELVEHRP